MVNWARKLMGASYKTVIFCANVEIYKREVEVPVVKVPMLEISMVNVVVVGAITHESTSIKEVTW
jgi:hypothetical protein